MEQSIETFTATFTQLQKKMKWHLLDKQTLMMIAAAYTMNNKPLHPKQFKKLANHIKGKAGLFSPLKSTSRFTTAAMLDVNNLGNKETVSELFSLYDKLVKAKFKRDRFTYLAATIIVTTRKPETDLDKVIHQAKKIYDTMKSNHPFLTSAQDIPLAIFLAFQEEDAAQRIELFYEKLNKSGLRKGNDLQFLSHILSIDTEKTVDDLVGQTIDVFDAFKTIGIKQKTKLYPSMGMLAQLPREIIDIEKVNAIYESFNNQRPFKWKKELNIQLAISFFIHEHLEDSNVTDVGLFTTLEMMLQVQQAVLISSVTAASTSASNSGN